MPSLVFDPGGRSAARRFADCTPLAPREDPHAERQLFFRRTDKIVRPTLQVSSRGAWERGGQSRDATSEIASTLHLVRYSSFHAKAAEIEFFVNSVYPAADANCEYLLLSDCRRSVDHGKDVPVVVCRFGWPRPGKGARSRTGRGAAAGQSVGDQPDRGCAGRSNREPDK